jgi:hypothetical protein
LKDDTVTVIVVDVGKRKRSAVYSAALLRLD